MLSSRQQKALNIVATITQLKKQGWRCHEIVEKLNQQGLTTLTDKPFTIWNVWQILKRLRDGKSSYSIGVNNA